MHAHQSRGHAAQRKVSSFKASGKSIGGRFTCIASRSIVRCDEMLRFALSGKDVCPDRTQNKSQVSTLFLSRTKLTQTPRERDRDVNDYI
jgi:hypothetical protein